MQMPLASRIIFTVLGVLLPVSAHLADMSNKSHIYNDRWTPHAKFHGGQTLSISIFLGALTIYLAWRKTTDRRGAVFAVAGFSSVYWFSQGTAICYPGTAFFDPDLQSIYVFGLVPIQIVVEIVFLGLTALASWLALRRKAQWVGPDAR